MTVDSNFWFARDPFGAAGWLSENDGIWPRPFQRVLTCIIRESDHARQAVVQGGIRIPFVGVVERKNRRISVYPESNCRIEKQGCLTVAGVDCR